MLEAFKKLPMIWRVVVIGVLALILFFVGSFIVNKIGASWGIWRDNQKDAAVEQQVKELEELKQKNNQEIAILKADNAKLKKERDDQD